MSAFPTSVDEITPAWLAEATGLPVEAVDIEQIGAGIGVMSALYRVRLTGDGCPETVVVKLPGLAEESVFTSTILRMYLREAAFFGELADQAPRAGAGLPPLHDRSRDEPVRARDGGPRRPPRRRPGEGHGDRRRRAGRRRPGRLARHLVGPGPRAGRARRHGQPGRPDLQGGAPDGVRRGVGEARQGAHHPRRHRRRSAPGGPTPCPASSTTWPRSRPRCATATGGPTTCSSSPTARWPPSTSSSSPPARGAYDLAYFVTQSLDRADAAAAREGPVRPLGPAPSRRAARRPRTTPPPGTTTARPPSSASSTPWSPGAAWTPATPARSTWPPPCSTASTEPSTTSTSPPCCTDCLADLRGHGVRWPAATPMTY